MKRAKLTFIIFIIFLVAFIGGYMVGLELAKRFPTNRGIHTVVKVEV